jgi:hypothetical protein
MRAAFVAISVWKFRKLSSAVSTICASSIGPWMRSNGSFGNTAVPSGTASTSHVNRKSRRYARNPASNSGVPSFPVSVARYAVSSAVNRSSRSHAIASASPAASV